MSQLPMGWVETSLNELSVRVTKGTTPTTHGFKYQDSGVRFVKAESLVAGSVQHDLCAHIGMDAHDFLRRSQLEAGDVLFTIAGTLGRVGIVASEDLPANTNQAVAIIRLHDTSFSPFIAKYLGANAAQTVEVGGRGTGLQNLNLQQVGDIRVRLPPVAEQHRITDKIDSLSSKSKRALDHLDHVPRLVQKYKERLLWAFYKDAHQGSQARPSLGDIASEVRNGLSKKPSDQPPGTPILRISAVRPGSVNLDDRRFYPLNERDGLQESHLRNGDLLFTRYNGNADFVAVCGMVRGLTEEIVYPDKLIRVRVPSEDAIPAFVEAVARSPQFREEISGFIKTAAGQHGISGRDLKTATIPLPSIKEQANAVRRIEAAFTWIDRLASEATSARKLIDHLDQAILSKAFRGELVPQDSNDEPASTLLERTRAEQTVAKPARGRRRSS